MKHCIIIGGGIIGLCSAYYLQKEGHEVTVIDQSNLDAGASYINAGLFAPSHLVPLSAPGVMKKGLKWMFDGSSPLYIKPRMNVEFLRWVWAFKRSCNQEHVNRAIPVIKEISTISQELYENLCKTEYFRTHYNKKGLLLLCKTDKMLEEEINVALLAKQHGLAARELNLDELKTLEPDVEINVKGATYYEGDSHTTPHEFMNEMKAYLKLVGVKLFKNEKVEDIQIHNGKITSINTYKQNLSADEYVLAAGSWSSLLSKKVGLKILLQAGKGYRIDTVRQTGITIPSILAEAKAAVTPMNGFTRFAGTMEIAGINQHINTMRVEAIAKSARDYYPNIELTMEEKSRAASGLRPVTPDGLPYIGKSKKCKNLTIATGHAMLGLSMAPATGKLVSQIISDQKPIIRLEPLHPDRRF